MEILSIRFNLILEIEVLEHFFLVVISFIVGEFDF